MQNAGVRIAAYALGLIVVFGLAALAGGRFGPAAATAGHGDTSRSSDGTDAGGAGTGSGHGGAGSGHGDAGAGHDGDGADHDGDGAGHDGDRAGHDGDGAGDAAAAGAVPGGLQVADGGYRLEALSRTLAVGAARPFAFRVLGPGGAPLVGYVRQHEKELHLIVVRRDLSGFQHLHPARAADGTWTVPLAVAEPGAYRVLADFRPAGRAEGLTLGLDVTAPGDYRPRELPAPQRTVTMDGYSVTMSGEVRAGEPAELTLTVRRDGRPVTDLQPYLGAYGHLVALRDGDLAYLHVHPSGSAGAGPDVRFTAEVPSAGAYRFHLDFRHGGVVRTVAFTEVVR